MHYYQHHIGDFIKATSRLTDAQSMTYLRLIWLYYEQEKPLPDDCDLLAFQLGSDSNTINLILKSFFKFDGKVWRQTRCDDLIATYQKQSVGGKLGAKNRWNGQKSKGINSPPIATPMPPLMGLPIATNNQEPITKNQSKDIASPEGVAVNIWQDYLKVRKAAKKPLTETALKGLAREAGKAGMSLGDALQICCERSWVGFKAEWLRDKQTTHERNMQTLSELTGGIHGNDFSFKPIIDNTINTITTIDELPHEKLL